MPLFFILSLLNTFYFCFLPFHFLILKFIFKKKIFKQTHHNTHEGRRRRRRRMTKTPLSSNSFFGIRTLRKGTAVSHSQSGNFTGLDLPDLLVSRGNRIDIYKVKVSGELIEVASIPLNGRVAYMQLLKRPGLTDTLFISTTKCKIAHLSWDPATGSVVSHATGSINEFCSRRCANGEQIGDLSPDGRLICLGVYRCELHFVCVGLDGELTDVFSVNLPCDTDQRIRDYRYVHFLCKPGGGSYDGKYVLSVLSRDCRSACIADVDVENRKVSYGSSFPFWPESKSCVFVQPTPLGGAFAGFEGGLTLYIDPMRKEFFSANTRHTISKCVRLTSTVYIGCDRTGGLYILSLPLSLVSSRTVLNSDLKIVKVGESPIASTLSVVNSRHIFVGSMFWDSKLGRIMPSKAAAGNTFWLEEAEAEIHSVCLLPNTGPFTDFSPLSKPGDVVVCMGGHRESATAILHQQYTLTELCVYKISDIYNLWILPDTTAGARPTDRFIVMSFKCGTFVLKLDESGSKFSPYHIKGISRKTQTLYCAMLPNKKFLRITPQKAIVIDPVADTKKDTFLVSHSTSEVKCVSFTRDGSIGVYSVEPCTINVVYANPLGDDYKNTTIMTFPSDVAALDAYSAPGLCAIALWNGDIGVMSFASKKMLCTTRVCNMTGAIRSIVFGKFDGCDSTFFLCGTSDGYVIAFLYENFEFKELWRIHLGVEQATLNASFASPDSGEISHVFASSLSSMRITAGPDGLNVAYIRTEEITSLFQFNGTVEDKGNIVVGIGDNDVHIYTMSEKPGLGVSRRIRQKTQIPIKVVYQKETDVIATITAGLSNSQSSIIIYDNLLSERK